MSRLARPYLRSRSGRVSDGTVCIILYSIKMWAQLYTSWSRLCRSLDPSQLSNIVAQLTRKPETLGVLPFMGLRLGLKRHWIIGNTWVSLQQTCGLFPCNFLDEQLSICRLMVRVSTITNLNYWANRPFYARRCARVQT